MSRRCRAAAAFCSAKCVIRTRYGRPSLDARLDRGAGVVDVHVDVPQAGTADDDERVCRGVRAAAAAGRRRPAWCRAGTSPRTPGRPRRGRSTPTGRRPAEPDGGASVRRGTASGPGRDRRAPRGGRRSPRPPASTTPARRSTSSCCGVRSSATRAAATMSATTSGSAVAARDGDLRGLRGGPAHRQDRALDRFGDRRPGLGRRRGASRRRPRRRRGPRARRARRPSPRRSWARDDPGVAPRSEQGAAGERVGDGAECRRPAAGRGRRSRPPRR